MSKNTYKQFPITVLKFFLFFATASFLSAQTAPAWVNNINSAYPSGEWVAVVASGSTLPSAEQAAMNSLARSFRTDVQSLSQATERFNQIISETAGKRTVSFEENRNFAQEVNTSTNIRGLIGVQTDQFQARNGTYYVNARMNRRECAARYTGMINENTAVINRLLSYAGTLPAGFQSYSALAFAANIAEVTDDFQNILEVLDVSATNRRPSYGGANAIKTRMKEIAGSITIGIALETENRDEATLIRRAIASFFNDRGFKTNEDARGMYVLNANVRFEPLAFSDRLQSCRYYFNASLQDQRGARVFSFTEDDRKNHNIATEARRLAVRAVETSAKEGKFAADFDTWLGTLIE